MKLPKYFGSIVFILILTVFAALIVWPSGPDFFGKEVKGHLGLDLQGGVQITYEADTSKIPSKDKEDALRSLVEVIQKRVDALGVAEPVIQTTKIGDKSGILVELAGIHDIDQALGLIGKTAKLDFRELAPEAAMTAEPENSWKDTGLSGKHLKRAQVTFVEQTSTPQISISFNNEGKKLFAEITERNIQKPLAIFLDNQLISAPTVQNKIVEGEAVITGDFDVQSANELVIQLNAGALPVPVEVAEQRTIGPTLGKASIKQSLAAALIGLILILWFMVANYRLSGILASIALAVYGLIVIALFKTIPITLTLAGIAGFILSLGMAVDANVLIFERVREEIRNKTNLSSAVEVGFKKAWLSIRDSNVSSLLIALILFWFGSGLIKGFALTLGIGILVSMFSAITITRTLLRVSILRLKNPKWY